MTLLFAAVLGWCGTKWPGWWWSPRGPYGPNDSFKPQPQPWRDADKPEPQPWRDAGKPQPDPWRVFGGLIGAVGGIGAVSVFRAELADAGLLATSATAFFGGFFLGDLVSSVVALGSRGPGAGG